MIVLPSIRVPVRPIARGPLRLNLRSMLGDGAAFSWMVGIGETYVPAFVLALGLGHVAAGLVATVPLLAGSLLQLAAPRLVRAVGSYRVWVASCAAGQSASLWLMAFLAWNPSWPPSLVFVAAAFYWGMGFAAGPAWNAWAEFLVPKRLRALFFARRVRVCQSFILLGLVTGGVLLRAAPFGLRATFGLLFVSGAVARLVSALLIARQTDRCSREPRAPSSDRTSAFPWRGSGARLVFYLMCVQVGVYLAGPYFTPYMLTKLRLPYFEYMLLLSAAFLGKIVALPWFGAYAKRAGANRLLWLGGIGIVPVAAAWIVSDSFTYLLAMQFVCGVVWAAHELAVFLLFFEAIPASQRLRLLTWYNVGNALAMVVGALLGAGLLRWMGDATSSYLTLFAVSSIARGLSIVALPGAAQRLIEAAPVTVRALTAQPAAGSTARPVPVAESRRGRAPSNQTAV